MNKYSIKTYVQNRDGKVYLYINYRDTTMYIGTGLDSNTKFTGREFPSSVPGAKAKTFRLSEMYNAVEDFIVHNDGLTAAEMKNKLKVVITGKGVKVPTLAELLREYAETKRAENTKHAYRCTANTVEAFDSHATLSTVTPDWLRRYEQHELTKTRPSQRKDGKGKTRFGRQQNGVAIDLRNIRAVFNWAMASGKTSNYPFAQFKIKHEQTRKRNLSADTMRHIVAHGGRYCDMFALMFYLIGINISDIYYLPKDCIRDGRLEYRRNKTGRLFSILVEPEALYIINRYAGKTHLLNFCETCKDHKVFLKHMNDELGKLYEGCTSYWCRHTWASIAASLDIPIETISQALGHSFGASVTNIYIHYDTRKVDEANRKVIDCITKEKPDAGSASGGCDI